MARRTKTWGRRIGKVVAVLLVVAALAVTGYYLFGKMSATEPGELLTATIERGDIERTVSCTGTLSAVETVDVGAQVSGTITKLHVDYNDAVTEGQVLLELDTELFKAEVRESKAQIKKAKAELKKAKADSDRVQKLFDKGYASQEDQIAAITQVQVASATLIAAQASSKRASAQLGYSVIRSPIDGKVLARNVEEGQTIASSFNTPSLFILAADLSRMKIEASVDESDIGLIQEGQSARFSVQAYPDRVYDGTVRQVRLVPETIQNVVKYTVVVDVANEDGTLLPGMTATVDFIVESRQGVLLVPTRALSFTFTPDMLPPPGKRGFQIPFLGEPGDGKRGRPPRPAAEGKERMWVEGKKGMPVPVDFVAGITDGSMTEIVSCDGIVEGTTVLTGYRQGSTEEKTQRKRLFGPPPGGRGPPL